MDLNSIAIMYVNEDGCLTYRRFLDDDDKLSPVSMALRDSIEDFLNGFKASAARAIA